MWLRREWKISPTLLVRPFFYLMSWNIKNSLARCLMAEEIRAGQPGYLPFFPADFSPQPNNLPRLKCTILGRNYKQSSRACEWSEMGEFTRQAVKVHFIPDYINCITVTTYPWENLCRLYIETYALPSCFINL